jgi:hypothetical protein
MYTEVKTGNPRTEVLKPFIRKLGVHTATLSCKEVKCHSVIRDT